MRPTIMYAYSNRSEGATLVAQKMGILKMNHDNSTWRPAPGKVVLNWGYGGALDVAPAQVINPSDAVMGIIDKRTFFRKAKNSVRGPRIPETTTSIDIAKQWLTERKEVLARTTTTGARGEGIVVMKRPIDIVYAPLYTVYIDKDAEFRVHVIGGEAVYFQQKIRDTEREVQDWHVRNYENGFILVKRISPVPPDAIRQSVRAVEFMGLDFGAVDVITKDDKAYVLEINSAPWMNDECATVYADKLKAMIGD